MSQRTFCRAVPLISRSCSAVQAAASIRNLLNANLLLPPDAIANLMAASDVLEGRVPSTAALLGLAAGDAAAGCVAAADIELTAGPGQAALAAPNSGTKRKRGLLGVEAGTAAAPAANAAAAAAANANAAAATAADVKRGSGKRPRAAGMTSPSAVAKAGKRHGVEGGAAALQNPGSGGSDAGPSGGPELQRSRGVADKDEDEDKATGQNMGKDKGTDKDMDGDTAEGKDKGKVEEETTKGTRKGKDEKKEKHKDAKKEKQKDKKKEKHKDKKKEKHKDKKKDKHKDKKKDKHKDKKKDKHKEQHVDEDIQKKSHKKTHKGKGRDSS